MLAARTTTLLMTLALGSALALPATATAHTPDQTAHYLAGMASEGFAADAADLKQVATYAKAVEPKWASYWKRIATPMIDWAHAELAQTPGETVFYPFSGPDFPTVAQLYPDAGRYILVALQTGGRVPRLDAMNPKHLRLYLDLFKRGFTDFTRRGYFRTDDLKADTGRERTIEGITPVLMAFAARMGFTVDSVTAVRISADGKSLEPHPGPADEVATWDSVRLALTRPDGKKVTLDYVHLDLSDDYLKQHDNARTWLTRASSHRTFTKAASHLMQKPFFSVVRDALIGHAPSVVQDETGLDYKDLNKAFDVTLYGKFDRAYHLWTEGVQRELVTAYKAAKGTKKLPFRVGYTKDAGSCLQVATRKP
ncbi:MAG: hypothetical protein CVU56_04830 [Deltaproteobacteria bacterium HGW-Deltaproteobacteria-14]|jgi:hypothetical protein|nr:MAG: hypothetical protein CVU56_04830 [Deltaproteobacteria bacterium HGW-Deltaproteobacteria-14]